MSTLAIVFGASGRLGRALLPQLAASKLVVLAVSRVPVPAAGVRWMQVDVTNSQHRARAFPVLQELASIHQAVVLLDLVLDRRSVRAMRRSIEASTSYVIRLGRHLTAEGCSVRYVLASTTAALAPWLLQTPYGLAKRRQLSAYLGEARPTSAVLLPSLSSSPGSRAWCYERAAHRLVLQTELAAEPSRLVVPTDCGRAETRGSPWLRGAVAQLASLSWRRNDPLAHRLASHARLRLVPAPWRPLIDHHLAPEPLVQRIAHQRGAAVKRVAP